MDINEKLTKNNLKFKDIYKGKRAFVIGNGSSLIKQNLHLLKDEITIVSNSFYRHPLINVIRPCFYLMVDPSLWNEYSHLMIERFEGMTELKNETEFFIHVKGFSQIKEHKLDKNFKISYLNYKQNHSLYDDLDFSEKIPEWSQTVTIVGIMLAIYLGVETIYLLGCDMDWTPQSGSSGNVKHFYNPTGAEEKVYQSIKNKEAKQFSDENFWEAATKNMFAQYKTIHKYAKIHNKEIFNATVGGKLEEFPRVRFNSLWKDYINELSAKAITEYNNQNFDKVHEYISEIDKIGEFPMNTFLLNAMSYYQKNAITEARENCLKELEIYPGNSNARNFFKSIINHN